MILCHFKYLVVGRYTAGDNRLAKRISKILQYKRKTEKKKTRCEYQRKQKSSNKHHLCASTLRISLNALSDN